MDGFAFVVFDRAVRGAELSLLWNAPCGGHYPRDFAVVDGYVICANEGGNVALFRLLDDGLERLPDPARMPDPLCVTVR